MADNENYYDCPFCEHPFDRKWDLQGHLNRKNKCYEETSSNKETLKTLIDKYDLIFDNPSCPHCHESFTKKSSLDRHLKRICPKDPNLLIKLKSLQNRDQKQTETQEQSKASGQNKAQAHNSSVVRSHKEGNMPSEPSSNLVTKADMAEMFKILTNMVGQLNNKVDHLQISSANQTLFQTNNSNFQVMAIDGDLLSILSEHFGDNINRAYLKLANCALGTIESDCRLIEDIYCLRETDEALSSEPALQYVDSKRTKVECFDKNGHRIIKTKAQLGDYLAVQIINGYSKTLKYFVDYHKTHKLYPIKNMDDSQLQDWNEHMGQLSDIKYRKKMVNHLNIPDKNVL